MRRLLTSVGFLGVGVAFAAVMMASVVRRGHWTRLASGYEAQAARVISGLGPSVDGPMASITPGERHSDWTMFDEWQVYRDDARYARLEAGRYKYAIFTFGAFAVILGAEVVILEAVKRGRKKALAQLAAATRQAVALASTLRPGFVHEHSTLRSKP